MKIYCKNCGVSFITNEAHSSWTICVGCWESMVKEPCEVCGSLFVPYSESQFNGTLCLDCWCNAVAEEGAKEGYRIQLEEERQQDIISGSDNYGVGGMPIRFGDVK